MVESLGNPFKIVSPGLSLKPYPCSYPQFRVANAALDIAAAQNLNADAIAQLEIRVTPSQARHVIPSPQSGLQGKCRLNYIVAASLPDTSRAVALCDLLLALDTVSEVTALTAALHPI
jgi:2-methylcitrate dehydratase PrpD